MNQVFIVMRGGQDDPSDPWSGDWTDTVTALASKEDADHVAQVCNDQLGENAYCSYWVEAVSFATSPYAALEAIRAQRDLDNS